MSGLWDAIRRHPDRSGRELRVYVRVRIRGAILDELRAQDWLPRRAPRCRRSRQRTDAYIPPPPVVRFDDVSEWEAKSLSRRRFQLGAAVAASSHKRRWPKPWNNCQRERHIVTSTTSAAMKFQGSGRRARCQRAAHLAAHSRAIQRLKTIINSAA